MSDQTRQEFERWAAEAFGGDISRFTTRLPNFPDEYTAADLQWAWRAWETAYAAGRSAGMEENRECLQALHHFTKVFSDSVLDKWNDRVAAILQRKEQR